MQYGPSSVSNLNTVLATTTFVASYIPPQVNSIQGVSGKLVEYAKNNKIGTPSKEEMESASKDMAKE
jgi:hypothetical protein